MTNTRTILKVTALLLIAFFALQSCNEEMFKVPGSGSGESFSVIESPAQTDLTLKSGSEEVVSKIMARRPVSYLEGVISPCIPVKDSNLDPCPPGELPRVANATPTHQIILPDPLPTFTQKLTGVILPSVVHIIIRGTVLPGTARCGVYPLLIPTFYSDSDQKKYRRYLHHYCFVEVRVNEYIIGEGPPQLTISTNQSTLIGPIENWGVSEIGGSSEEIDKVLRDPATRVDSAYAGREMVLFLRVSTSHAVETWNVANVGYRWFVQRDGEEVRAVSDMIKLAKTDEHRRRLDMLLEDLVREVKQAHQNRLAITGGRIADNPSLPLLVSDANKLQDYYGAVGAVYEGDNATILPPPIPGGGEPAQPPVQTGEDQPTASIPAPGDEISPPPTDDASINILSEAKAVSILVGKSRVQTYGQPSLIRLTATL